ncbi:phosphate ABC transporter substrate-binding protein PstS [Eleftheria terrae]|uniref:phosphate ABC transporter substrate-binding protein PstS n=1 Tax=Eleftheria terrae TaxID=1597781 RepID=UPI00263ABE78|nr:phosphate ABC transporter substrate-binding protein PstS [Eleftheria terrae]WKB54398.1 phosphate ABC transporter substrate-binding protein PstS [Eleftheria terrae]
MRFAFLGVGAALVLSTMGATAAEPEVRGAGASFPAKVYSRWGEAFARESGVRVSYAATGSGAGVREMAARRIDFGASDSPLDVQKLSKDRLIQFPTMVGGLVPVVQLEIAGGQRLQLTGPVLAAIMQGEVRVWNDARIADLNRGLVLPALPIRRVVRADASGSSESYTRYLGMVSAKFAAAVVPSLQPAWPGEVIRVEGSDGMSKAIRNTPGGIGYTSFDRVDMDQLRPVKLQNRAGNYVDASPAAFRAAVTASGFASATDNEPSLLDQAGPQSWPITQATYVLLDAQPPSATAARNTLRFFYGSFMKGDKLLDGTGFAPLPTTVQARVLQRFQQIRPQDGSDVLGVLR